jgi:hypothetical protein
MTLASPHANAEDLAEIASAVESLETIRVRELTRLLAHIERPAAQRMASQQSSTAAA